MPDEKQSNRIICEGGLDSSQNYLFLSENKPGAATRLLNYEVGLNGGYRRISGYELYDDDFGEVGVGVAEGKVLGIIIFENSVSGAFEIIAARKDLSATTYSLYLYEFGTGWTAISTGLTHNYSSGGSTVDKLRYDVGNDGAGNVLCIVDGVNNALLYDGTTWAFIDSADSGADMANAGGAQAVNAPTIVSFFSSTLFLGGDTVNTAAGVVAYSAPNAFYDWTSANGAGQLIAGFPVIQTKSFRDSLFIFGSNAIKRAVADESVGFLVKDVTNNIGCLARDSIVEIGGDLIFLAPDGFRPIAGTNKIGDVQLETISKHVQSLILKKVVTSSGLDINTVAIRSKSQFRMFFSSSNLDATDSRGIIAGLRSADQQAGWEFGELLGFRASCATSRYINEEELVLHGDYDGMVYQQEQGTSLNGSDMVSVYSTPYLDFGDTEIRKVIEKATIFVQGEGTLGILLNLDFDWGKDGIAAPLGYTIAIEGVQPIYGDSAFVYGDPATVYGGSLTPVAISNLEGSFFSTRLTFTTSGTEASHSIHSMVLEYAVKGRL